MTWPTDVEAAASPSHLVGTRAYGRRGPTPLRRGLLNPDALAARAGPNVLLAFLLGALLTAVGIFGAYALKVYRALAGQSTPSERADAIALFLLSLPHLLWASTPLLIVGGLVGVLVSYVVHWVGSLVS